MTIEVGVLIAVVGLMCTILGALIGYFTFLRNRDKDLKKETKESATESAVIRTKLDSIGLGVDNIRIDMKSNERVVTELSKDLIRVDESTKQAHKRIDAITGKST